MGDKTSNWTKAATVIQALVLIFAVVATFLSYESANKANDLTKTANDLTKQSLDILSKQSNYTLQVFPYPIYAIILGDYENGSSEPVLANGFLNTTFIIISPDVIRLTIETMSLRQINEAENGSVMPDPTMLSNFDQAKFDQWSINFSTDSNLRHSAFPSLDNNFTYYTSHAGISSIAISLPINGTFYLNPHHSFELYTTDNETLVQLGNVTVNAQAFDVQTEQMTPETFSTILYTQVKIL
jgi:hypothetical protein